MKNYYKRGIAPKDRWFITGYQKGIRVDEFGNVIEVLEVRMADGHYEVYDYSIVVEINILKKMRNQFKYIDALRLKGRQVREYEKVKFFLDNEDRINKALFQRAKKSGFYKGQPFIEPKTLETLHRLPGLERYLTNSIIKSSELNFRPVSNNELAEKLGISLEELEEIKKMNPNPAIPNSPLLVSSKRLDETETELGMQDYGLDLSYFSRNEIIRVLTGACTQEEAEEIGLRVVTEKEMADMLKISPKELKILRTLENNIKYLRESSDINSYPELPLITINDLDSYSLEDLQNIINNSYGKEYEERPLKNREKRFTLKPLYEKIAKIGLAKKKPSFF